MDMEEKDFAMDSIVERMEEMKLEIAALKEALAAKIEGAEDCECKERGAHSIDLNKIKNMLEESFEKLTDTLRPLLEKAGHKISDPAKAAVARAEEKIIIKPFTAVAIALGAGFILGKICTFAANCYHCDCYDEEDDDE